MRLRVAAGFAPSLMFENPVAVWTPSRFEDALAALDAAQQALNDGSWIAGAISYEFGAMLQGIVERAHDPLLILGAFDKPVRVNDAGNGAFALSAPLSRVSFDAYAHEISYILRRINDGEVYQVNYTVPFDAGFSGDPFALFAFLAPRARAPYSAFVECNGHAVVSISPELFLRLAGDRVSTKPMKGTAPLERIGDLQAEKNRAEHLMIVDLLRNDLSRICDEVGVEDLFEVERYPTFATMTSTISGTLRTNVSLTDVLRAAFPCGSVTGAPKRAAMQHIAEVERDARGFYTGTIGFLSPGRTGWWNVPIRTLQIDCETRRARYDAGGGIVSDSGARSEWEEILLKSRFLAPAYDGFALLETFRAGANPSNVRAHLARLQRSGEAFGLRIDMAGVKHAIADPAHSTGDRIVRVRVRDGDVEVSSEPVEAHAAVELCFSEERVRSDDPFLAHKSSWRPAHDAAASEARERGCFDAVLRNERGELTEGARTNIFVRKGNTLYTPPLSSGVLPGILRSRLISEGQAVERVLTQDDLESADAVLAGNSARGLLPARIR